jgi:hypothetical protein
LSRDAFAELLACHRRQEFVDIWLSLSDGERAGLRHVKAVAAKASELSLSLRSRH